MPCSDFENLLINYAELAPADRGRTDLHLLACAECRDWFESLAEVDAALASAFEGVHAPATLAVGVQHLVAQSVTPPVSAVPEILDFVGGLGVICATALLAYFFLPPSTLLSAPILFAWSSVLLGLTVAASVWALSSSES